MTDPDRGTDRAGRRSKRFLTPTQKYEVCVSFALAARPPDGGPARPVPADRIWLGLHGRAPGNPFTVFRVA